MPTKKSVKHPKPTIVLVRTYSAGVHFGELISRKGQEVKLANARRLWRWFGANTLHEVALRGVMTDSKVSEAVPSIELMQAIEVIPMQPAAIAAMSRVSWSK